MHRSRLFYSITDGKIESMSITVSVEGLLIIATDLCSYYSRLYYEAMDLAMTSIKDRFDQPGFHMIRNLETVLVNAANIY